MEFSKKYATVTETEGGAPLTSIREIKLVEVGRGRFYSFLESIQEYKSKINKFQEDMEIWVNDEIVAVAHKEIYCIEEKHHTEFMKNRKEEN